MGTVPIPQGANIDPTAQAQAQPGAVPIPSDATVDPVPQDVTIPAAQDIPGGSTAGGVLGGLLSGAPSGIGGAIQRGVTEASPEAKAAITQYPGGGDPFEDLLRGVGQATGIPFLESADKTHKALGNLISAITDLKTKQWAGVLRSGQNVGQPAQGQASDFVIPKSFAQARRGEAPTPPSLSEAKQQAPTAGQAKLRDAPPEIATAIQQAATKYGLDPKLIQAVVQAESNFNPKATNPRSKGGAGEIGLMQLTDETRGILHISDQDAFDIQKNIDAGARWLKQKIDAHGGDLRHGLTAYNGSGPKAQRYADNVLALYGGQGSP